MAVKAVVCMWLLAHRLLLGPPVSCHIHKVPVTYKSAHVCLSSFVKETLNIRYLVESLARFLEHCSNDICVFETDVHCLSDKRAVCFSPFRGSLNDELIPRTFSGSFLLIYHLHPSRFNTVGWVTGRASGL